MAAFGLGYVINTVQTHELLLQIIGGIFLLCIGLKIYFDNPIRQIRQRRQGRVSKTGLLGDYLSLFFFFTWRVAGGDRGAAGWWRVVVHAFDVGKYLP